MPRTNGALTTRAAHGFQAFDMPISAANASAQHTDQGISGTRARDGIPVAVLGRPDNRASRAAGGLSGPGSECGLEATLESGGQSAKTHRSRFDVAEPVRRVPGIR
jgi:hypothetical protein